MNKTKIDWCTHTVNPVVGCTFGCTYCYARKMNKRFGWIKDFSKPEFFPDRLKQLYSKRPKIIFMDSVSDIADWNKWWRDLTFSAMRNNPQHKYLFLTKRPEENCFELNKVFSENRNWWFGVSVTRQKDLEKLAITPIIPNRFVSIEPILEFIDIEKRSVKVRIPFVDWVIVGAETSNRKGKIIPQREWVETIAEQCKASNVPIFMKESLRQLMGDDFVQQYPWEVNV